MKRLLLIPILTLSFQTFTRADDISDFQIEGMSVGDSLLDFFSLSSIEANVISDYNDNEYSRVNLRLKKFNDFEIVQFHIKTKDKKYIIQSLSAGQFYDDINECYSKMEMMDKEIQNISTGVDRQDFGIQKHPTDLKSTIKSIYYYFKSGDGFRLACFDWSKKMTKENNWRDHIKISAFTNEITTWFNEKAYK